MKSFRIDAKIEYRTITLEPDSSEYRYLQYRICPSELNLWQRMFRNKWRYVYVAYNNFDGFSYTFEVEEAIEITSKHRTWGEIADFLNYQYRKGTAKNREKALKEANDNLMWKSIK